MMLANLQLIPLWLWLIAILGIVGTTSFIIWVRRRKLSVTKIEVNIGVVKITFEPVKSLHLTPPITQPEIIYINNKRVTTPVVPTTIIRYEEDWYVYLQWELTGSLANIIDGDWSLQLFLESVGAGFEGEVNPPGDTVPVNPSSPNYDHRFHVSARTVPVGNYKAILWIRYIKPDGTPGPMSGFYEVPLLKIYTP